MTSKNLLYFLVPKMPKICSTIGHPHKKVSPVTLFALFSDWAYPSDAVIIELRLKLFPVCLPPRLTRPMPWILNCRMLQEPSQSVVSNSAVPCASASRARPPGGMSLSRRRKCRPPWWGGPNHAAPHSLASRAYQEVVWALPIGCFKSRCSSFIYGSPVSCSLFSNR